MNALSELFLSLSLNLADPTYVPESYLLSSLYPEWETPL